MGVGRREKRSLPAKAPKNKREKKKFPERETDKQTDRQTDKQTDRHTDRQDLGLIGKEAVLLGAIGLYNVLKQAGVCPL